MINKHAYVCQCAKISQTAQRFVLLCAVPWVLSKVDCCLLAVEEVGVGKNQSQTEPNCFFPHQDFFYEDMESLTQMLRALATDGNKHRAKVDKRKQRSVFRDVLRAVEVGPEHRHGHGHTFGNECHRPDWTVVVC